jgi:hypothetical protein
VLNQPGQRGARGSEGTGRVIAPRQWYRGGPRETRSSSAGNADGVHAPGGGRPGGVSGGRPRGGCGVRCGRSPLVAHSAIEGLATQLGQGDRVARSAADMVVRAKRLPAIAPACPGVTAVRDERGLALQQENTRLVQQIAGVDCLGFQVQRRGPPRQITPLKRSQSHGPIDSVGTHTPSISVSRSAQECSMAAVVARWV